MIQGPASSPAASNVGAGTEIISLVMRPGGASKNELMHATRWQWHSIRGFVSFVMRKEMGLPIPRYCERYRVELDCKDKLAL